MISSIIGFFILVCAFLIVALGIPGLMIAIPVTGFLLAVVVVLIGVAGQVLARIRGAA